MRETQRLLDAVKRQLRARGITYAELGRRIGLSESSVKRLFASGNFTLTRLERICGVLQLTLADLARTMDGLGATPAATLTEEQEHLLASEAGILACFYLLLNGHTTADCRERLRLHAPAVDEILKKLASVGLVTGSGKTLQLSARLPLSWRPEGPVRKLYERQVREEFMQCAFKAPGESLAFHSAELSPASVRVLRRKLDKVSADFAELAALDLPLPSREKTSVALLLAMRPWVFSMFDGLRTAAD
ncbi:MAG: helix-turn-helix transcriptional regulator [Steroidobacteraceae bacterium]